MRPLRDATGDPEGVLAAAEVLPYYGHLQDRLGEPVWMHVHSHPKTVQAYGTSAGDVAALSLREARHGEDTPYFGWLSYEDRRFSMVYPALCLTRMCFAYGPEAEEDRGRGRLVNLVVEPAEKIAEEAPTR